MSAEDKPVGCDSCGASLSTEESEMALQDLNNGLPAHCTLCQGFSIGDKDATS